MLETYRGFNRCYMIEGNLWTLLSVRGKLVLQIMFNALPHPPDTPIFLFQLIWSYFLFPDQVKLPVFSKNFSPDQVHKLRKRKIIHPIQKTGASVVFLFHCKNNRKSIAKQFPSFIRALKVSPYRILLMGIDHFTSHSFAI